MQRKIKWPLFAISLWSLTSLTGGCTPKPPDVPACEYLTQKMVTDPKTGHVLLTPSPTCVKQIGEPECGHCVYIVSGMEIFLGENKGHWLNGKPWSVLRQQTVYLPAEESYAPLATYIINSCKKMGCSDAVDKFKVKLDSLNGIIPAITN